MLPSYFGQYIFNAQGSPWALEVLFRSHYNKTNRHLMSSEVFSRAGVNDQDFYGLDLLVINWIYNHWKLIGHRLPVSHIFFNASDFLLRELCLQRSSRLFETL